MTDGTLVKREGYVCIYVCVCIYMYVCMYVCVYIYSMRVRLVGCVLMMIGENSVTLIEQRDEAS